MLGIVLAVPVVAVFGVVLWAGLRPRAKHRSWRRATTPDSYVPQHAAPYQAKHEADVDHGPVVLGAHPDGDITLVHADLPPEPAADLGDEPTVEVPRELIGAGA